MHAIPVDTTTLPFPSKRTKCIYLELFCVVMQNTILNNNSFGNCPLQTMAANHGTHLLNSSDSLSSLPDSPGGPKTFCRQKEDVFSLVPWGYRPKCTQPAESQVRNTKENVEVLTAICSDLWAFPSGLQVRCVPKSSLLPELHPTFLIPPSWTSWAFLLPLQNGSGEHCWESCCDGFTGLSSEENKQPDESEKLWGGLFLHLKRSQGSKISFQFKWNHRCPRKKKLVYKPLPAGKILEARNILHQSTGPSRRTSLHQDKQGWGRHQWSDRPLCLLKRVA